MATTPVKTITTHMPLTTIFTPPGWCADQQYTFFYSSASGLSTYWRDWNGKNDILHPSCWPPNYSYQHQTDPFVIASYSPGVCPDGWTAAKHETNGDVATSWCCPFGKTLSSRGCRTTITTPTEVALNAFQKTTTSNFVGVDWYIEVAWASSDLKSFSPTSAPLLPTYTSTSTPSSNTNKNHLSTGAQAGIGVGIATAALLIILLVFLMFWRRRRRQRQMQRQSGKKVIEAVELESKPAPSVELEPEARLYEAPPDTKIVEADPDCELAAELQGRRVIDMTESK